jgi:hypothetical protein
VCFSGSGFDTSRPCADFPSPVRSLGGGLAMVMHVFRTPSSCGARSDRQAGRGHARCPWRRPAGRVAPKGYGRGLQILDVEFVSGPGALRARSRSLASHARGFHLNLTVFNFRGFNFYSSPGDPRIRIVILVSRAFLGLRRFGFVLSVLGFWLLGAHAVPCLPRSRAPPVSSSGFRLWCSAGG